MKKVFYFVLSFLLGVGACIVAGTNFSYAAGDNKDYLISPTFASETGYQSKYNIEEDEVFATFTPTSANGVLAGASIKPKSSATDNSFDKTYLTKAPGVEISAEKSLFITLFFNGKEFHNLKIVASDGTNSIIWNISKNVIASEVNSNTSTSRIRYGWVTVELPASQNITITSLQFVYASDSSDDGISYSQMYFYAPYVADKQNDNIAFSQKQKYYNYSVKFANYDYVNDKLGIFSASDLFEYCYIGDVNYLASPTDDYYFILSVTNNSTATTVSHTLKIGTFDFQYTFNEIANYEISVSLYDSLGTGLWVVSRSYNINEFVALYLSQGLPDMQKGQTFSFDINISSLLIGAHDLTAVSTNSKVASAEVKDGKLYVSANGRGSCDITIKITGKKGTSEEQTYSSTYRVFVSEKNEVNWWLMGGVAIFLIVAGVVVYTIMVRRRMIRGKYPKY
ncbi:MAG: hypothetical protein IJ542_02135 [Clostridia bacterium]|nr:hypothetical protein [Clostridia bacterium]